MCAPYIGEMGLDIGRKCSREELAVAKCVPLNSSQPFYPDLWGNAVCELRQGVVAILC